MNISVTNYEFFMVGLFSLLIGSLLNVLIYRIPLGLNYTSERSKCLICNHQLNWYHNIPLFSWLFLMGRCAFCSKPISYQYPLVEFTSMLLGLTIYLQNGLSISSISMYIVSIMLISLSFIDFKYKAIPDNLSFVAIFFSFFVLDDFISNFIYTFFIVILIFVLKIVLEKILKKEVLGIGDFYIFIIMANIFTIKYFLSSIFIASFLSLFILIFLKIKEGIDMRSYQLPFVPFLTLSIFIVYFLNLNLFILLVKI